MADEEREEEWLTLRETRARLAPLKVTDQTLRNWAAAGRLIVIRTDGGQRRFAASSVERELVKFREQARRALSAAEPDDRPTDPDA